MSTALPYIDKDNPQKYNGVQVSYGISSILNTLADLANSSSRIGWNLYLINVETIIRDRKDQITDIGKIAHDTLTDCNLLAQYIATYNVEVLRNTTETQPMILFYLPHYENISKIYLRDKFPKGTEDRWKIRKCIEEIILTGSYQHEIDTTKVMYSVVGNGTVWPHKDIIRDLNSIIERLIFRKVLMVSHVPADFHLYRFFRDFTILESYTGKLKKSDSFGQKVFKNDVFPFNKYTHLLLGDKWYLKGLIKGNKAKADIVSRATKEHWNLLPDKIVLQHILDAKLTIPDLLIKPDI